MAASVTLYHPVFENVTRRVDPARVDAWVASGWLLEEADPDYVDHADVFAVQTEAGVMLRAILDDGTEITVPPVADDSEIAKFIQDPTTVTGATILGRERKTGLAPDPETLPWRVALAGRYSAPVNLVCMGTSFTEGTGVSSWRTRWQSILQGQLRAKYQPAGVSGAALPYIPAFGKAGGTITDWPVTRTGTFSEFNWSGLGLRGAEWSSDASTLTFTFTGTSAAVAYVKGTFGKMLVSVDGGTAVSTDTYGTSVSGGNLYNIPGLTAGEHTVTITRDPTSAAGRKIAIEGLHVWNGDETKGVRVVDAGRHGETTSSYLVALATGAWPGSLKAAKPSGIILDLGFNDASNGETAATFESRLTQIIDLIRTSAQFAGTIFLASWPKRAVNTQEVWDAYTAVLEGIAAAEDKVVILPLIDWLPAEGASYADPTNMGIYDSTDHPKQSGHAMIADIIAKHV